MYLLFLHLLTLLHLHLPTSTMESLRARVKFYLTRQQHLAIRPCSEILCMTTLSGLPPELLLSISDYLPLVDRICLSLCNWRLLELTRRQTKWLSSQDKFVVLTRLENDLPEYFACAICNLLHRYDGSESFGLSGLPDKRTSQPPCVERSSWLTFEQDKWFG